MRAFMLLLLSMSGYDQNSRRESMTTIQLDKSHWPVIVVTPMGVASSEELSRFFDQYAAMLKERPEVYALIVDLRRSSDMPAAQRKVLTDFMKKQEDVVGKLCAGTVLVFESAVMRAILTAVFWVKNPSQEVRVCSTVQEGLEWASGAVMRKRKQAA